VGFSSPSSRTLSRRSSDGLLDDILTLAQLSLARPFLNDTSMSVVSLGAAMITTRNIVLVLLLGSAWGLAEVFGRDLLAEIGVAGATIWLAVWAVLLLSLGRGLWNKIGSSTLMGLVAATFKFAGPSLFFCQLLGIAAIGLFFDLFASALLARGRDGWRRHALVGVLTVYAARVFFVGYSVFVARWDLWADGGVPMALEHIAVSGSIAAVAAGVLAPLGFRVGRKAAEILSGDPAGNALTAEKR